VSYSIAIIGIFFLLFLLAGVVYLVWCYQKFTGCIEVRWRERVFRRQQELVDRKAELSVPLQSVDRVIQEERERVFAEYLSRFSVNELQQFHGIGPKTIELLKDAGYRKISDMLQRNVEDRLQNITGIGPTKAGDISSGLKRLIKTYRQNFETQHPPEYLAFLEFEKSTTSRYRAEAQLDREELDAIEQALSKLRNRWESAKQITFLNFALRKMPRITKEIFDSPVPELPKRNPSTKPKPAPAPPPKQAPPQPKKNRGAEPVAKPVVTPIPKPPVIPPITWKLEVPPPPSPKLIPTIPKPLPKPILEKTEPDLPAPIPFFPPATQLLLDRLYLVARFGVLVGKSDGRLAKAERKVLRTFLGDEYGSDDIAKNHIDPALEKVEKEILDEGQILTDVKNTFTLAFLRRLLDLAERIAKATGTPNAKELAALKRYSSTFGLEATPEFAPVEEVVYSPPSPATVPPNPEPEARSLAAKPALAQRPAPTPENRKPAEAPQPAPSTDIRHNPDLDDFFGSPNEPKQVESKQTEVSSSRNLEKPNSSQEAPPADIRHNPDLDDVFGM